MFLNNTTTSFHCILFKTFFLGKRGKGGGLLKPPRSMINGNIKSTKKNNSGQIQLLNSFIPLNLLFNKNIEITTIQNRILVNYS